MDSPLTDLVLDAVSNGDVNALIKLVAENGADAVRLEEQPEELTALHLAAGAGQMKAVNYLLSLAVGADPNLARINNFTPLHSAAMEGHAAICEALLRAGADVNV